MKVILRCDYESVGSAGDVVEVKPGFARNFLIPKKIAMTLNKGNMKILEMERKSIEMQQNRELKLAGELAEKLEKVSVTASVTVGEDDRIFGTVTPQNISDLLSDKGYDIDKKSIIIEEQIKALGIYPVKIKLHPELETNIKLWVVKG